jgi:hypothetical protein
MKNREMEGKAHPELQRRGEGRKYGLQMNDTLTDTYNPIFDILIKASSNI